MHITTTATPYLQSFSYDWLGNLMSLTNGTTSTSGTPPAILDTLPLPTYKVTNATSDSRTYSVPTGGSNKLFVALIAQNNANTPSATLNGSSLTISRITGTSDRMDYYIGYLAAPASGTFQINFPVSTYGRYAIFTVQNAAQTNPIDVSSVTNAVTASQSTSVTTSQALDLLISYPWWANASWSSFGTNENTLVSAGVDADVGYYASSYKAAGLTAGTETMTTTLNTSQDLDEPVIAIKAASAPVVLAATTSVYTYAGSGFANPDAVTAIGNGAATSSYTYDANGNLIQAGGWSYVWDYLNRMLSAGFGNSTTTYAYDAMGARVLQTSTTSTTFYPNKFYSFASMLVGSTTYATSTNYLWNGDTLLATVDQPMINGAATGSPITRFIHADHLGSTNAVTDQSGNLVQLLDYYPYGATWVSTSTYPTNEKRQYIDQFSDAQTGLDYLNARYYDGVRGQFLSQDPVFWEIGQTQDGKAVLSNPQALNSYGYANGNPVTGKDPNGRLVEIVSRPVFNVNGTYVGAHTFFLINPDNPSQIHINGLSGGIPTFTLGGYPTGSGINPFTDKLTKSIGTFQGGNDNAWVFGGAPALNKMTITPPEGQTDTQFVNSLGKAYNDVDLNGMGYFGLGSMPGVYNGNSNNFAYTLGQKAGVGQQMNNFVTNPGRAGLVTPGYGQTLPTTSVYKQIQATINSIKATISELMNKATVK